MIKKNTWLEVFESPTYELCEPDYEKIMTKEFVKKLRLDLKMSQKTFANLLGVSNKTIEKWEQGVNKVKGGDSRLLYLLSLDNSLSDYLLNLHQIGSKQKYMIIKNVQEDFDMNFKENNPNIDYSSTSGFSFLGDSSIL